MDYLFLGVMLFSVLLIVGLGIAVKYFRAYWLIAGYNTMSNEKKKRVHIVGLAHFTGNMCFIMGALMALATVFILIKQETLGLIVFGAFIPLSIYMIIKAQQFDGNTKNRDGSMTKKSKLIVGVIIAFLILTSVGAGILLYYSDRPAEFTIDEHNFSFSGMYGEKIPLEQIESVSINNEPPKILARTNGSSLGTKKKGYFKLDGISKAKLSLDTSKPPFILLIADNKYYFFNCEDAAKTEELYQQLKLIVDN